MSYQNYIFNVNTLNLVKPHIFVASNGNLLSTGFFLQTFPLLDIALQYWEACILNGLQFPPEAYFTYHKVVNSLQREESCFLLEGLEINFIWDSNSKEVRHPNHMGTEAVLKCEDQMLFFWRI